jgi:iron complex outermembrane receptor protein
MAEWGQFDQPATFTYDERGGGDMPLFDAGFNAADPNQWTILKGVSFLRYHKKSSKTATTRGRPTSPGSSTTT